MEHCTVETGLLRKKPCGNAAVATCANCERPLCSHHALAQLSDAGKKTGAFLCKECDDARRAYDKRAQSAAAAALARGPVARPKAASKPEPREQREHSGEIAFTSDAKAPPPKPAAAAPQPKKPEPPREDSGVIEYSPGKKPGDKK
jgi:RNase P subunit RPR2